MITQEQIDDAVSSIHDLTGEKDPEAIFLVIAYRSFVATVGPVEDDESVDMRACMTLLETLSDEELTQVQNRVESLLDGTEVPS